VTVMLGVTRWLGLPRGTCDLGQLLTA
jgi:hypothetical protein